MPCPTNSLTTENPLFSEYKEKNNSDDGKIKIDINNLLPDDLVIAPINRRGFENIDPSKDFEITEARNREELSVN